MVIFAQKLIDTGFELPPLIRNPKSSLDNFFQIVDYAIVIACLSKQDLKDAYYPNIIHDCNAKSKYYGRMMGVLNCISSIFKSMEKTANGATRLIEVKFEHQKIVGSLISAY